MNKKEQPRARAQRTPITRRGVLAGAAAGVASLAGSAGMAVQAPAAVASDHAWKLLSPEQGELLSHLCEHILPRTETPGARDAGVPEWIDLAVSVADSSEQLALIGGLAWVDQRAQLLHQRRFVELTNEQQVSLLEEISDTVEEPAGELEAGHGFFADLKERTLFAYFTSKTGREHALKLPTEVRREALRGCTHGQGAGPGGHGR